MCVGDVRPRSGIRKIKTVHLGLRQTRARNHSLAGNLQCENSDALGIKTNKPQCSSDCHFVTTRKRVESSISVTKRLLPTRMRLSLRCREAVFQSGLK